MLTNLYPDAEPAGTTNNRYNYVLSALEPLNRLDMKTRFDWNITNNTKAYVRIARENEDVEGAAGMWWGASEVALPTPERSAPTRAARCPATSSRVLSPSMTNEALVSWSRLQLDNTYKDPAKMTGSMGLRP